MSEPNLFLKSIKESAGIRLAILFVSFLIGLILSSIFVGLIDQFSYGDSRTHILLSSIVQCLLAFCLPAFVLAHFCSKDWGVWLKLTKMPSLKSIAGVLLIYVISMPAMEALIEWNSSIHLPESLSSLENTFRTWEDNAQETTKTILETQGMLAVISGVLVIGILTGFSEELFFRGGLQGIFQRSSIGKHMAVWSAAFIFSMMHFQFFGFFPRLLMGAFFGYLLIWTETLWVPIFAHALNNSMVVIAAALTGDANASMMESTNTAMYAANPVGVALSIFLTVVLLVFGRKYLFKDVIKWQKSQQPPVTETL